MLEMNEFFLYKLIKCLNYNIQVFTSFTAKSCLNAVGFLGSQSNINIINSPDLSHFSANSLSHILEVNGKLIFFNFEKIFCIVIFIIHVAIVVDYAHDVIMNFELFSIFIFIHSRWPVLPLSTQLFNFLDVFLANSLNHLIRHSAVALVDHRFLLLDQRVFKWPWIVVRFHICFYIFQFQFYKN